MTRRRIVFVLRIAVSIALLGMLGLRLADMGAEAWPPTITGPLWLVVAVILLPVSVAVRSENFRLLTNKHEAVLSHGQAAYLTLVGVAANMFLPAGTGDLVKANIGHRTYGSAEEIVASSVIDKLTSLVTVALLGLVGAIVSGDSMLAWVSVAITTVSGALVAFPRLIPWRLMLRVVTPSAQIDPDRLARVVKPDPRVLTFVLALSMIGWTITYSMVWAVCRSLGLDVSVGYVFAMAPFMTLSGLIPISLGGIGLGQVTMAYMLTLAGVPESMAIQAAFVYLAISLLPGMTGVALYAFRDGHARRQAPQR